MQAQLCGLLGVGPFIAGSRDWGDLVDPQNYVPVMSPESSCAVAVGCLSGDVVVMTVTAAESRFGEETIVSTGNKIESLLEQIRSVTKAHAIALVEVVPAEPEGHTSYEVDLDPEEFLEVMSLARPKIVYIETSRLAAKWMIGLYHDWVEDDERGDQDSDKDSGYVPTEEQLERTIAMFPELMAAVKNWSHRDGQMYAIEGIFFTEGVYHTMSLHEDWMAEFYRSMEQLKASHLATAEAAAQRSWTRRRTAFSEMAERLANDPMFTVSKVTREKREYLASKLYPDLDEREWGRLVSEAANIVWYRPGADGGGRQH